MAVGARFVQLASTGVIVSELRKHDVLIGVSTAIAVGGFLSGVAVSKPLPVSLFQQIFASGGAILLVATYGPLLRGLKELTRSLALGNAFLAISGAVMAPAGGRWLGYGTHPNLYGHSLVMGVACAVAAHDWSSSRGWRWFWVACALIDVVGIYQSGSRGSLIGLGVAGLFYLMLSGRTRLVALAAVAGWCAVVVVLAGIVTIPAESAIGRLLGKTETVDYADQAREEALDNVIEVITDKPILGDGFELSLQVHVLYLQYWQAGGALAGLAMMLLGVACVLLPIGRPRWALAVPCGAAGIAVAWIFTNVGSTRDQWIFLVLAFRVARAGQDLRGADQDEPITAGAGAVDALPA